MKKNIKSRRQTFFFHQHRKNALGYMARTKVEPSFLNFSSVCLFVCLYGFNFLFVSILASFSSLTYTIYTFISLRFYLYISLSLFLLVWLGVRFEGRLGISYASGSSLSLSFSLFLPISIIHSHTHKYQHTLNKNSLLPI